MKTKRFSVEQIVAVLKEAEAGMPVAELIRRIGISEQTFYRWKKQYAGLDSDQARQLKQLQEENERLKKLVAELSLDLFEDGLETQSGKKLKPGVWYFAIDKDENPIQTRVCFPLYVEAVTLEGEGCVRASA